MNRHVALACKPEISTIPVASILPLKQLTASVKKTRKYQCIAASIREIGIIEPLIVYPQPDQRSLYMLLDGHIRL